MAETLSSDQASETASMREMANAIRFLSMDAIQKANSGHPGMPMGMADVATVLFSRFMKFDVSDPAWPNRDRFVLSAGHGSMLQYALLYLTGMPGMDIENIKNFRQMGSNTAGHPEYGHTVGVETTTGPLGQGLANAVGMAMAEQILSARYGEELVDHYTYTIAGDGCLMEGISHEAISLAGHLQLSKLIVLFDDNSISIDGSTDIAVSDNQLARFTASGWDVQQIDGHDEDAIAGALEAAQKSKHPSLIACRTIIGYGAPNKQGTAATHGEALGDEEIEAARQNLGWTAPPFEIPDHILSSWRSAGQRNKDLYSAWQAKAAELDEEKRVSLSNAFSDAIKANAEKAIEQVIAEFSEAKPKLATRASSQKVLEKLIPAVPSLIGGSADLTGSNGTKTSYHTPISADNFGANYLHYGVREHGMAAAMNGMALHGGIVPYGATFLVFTDYCRPSIRLSALMEQRVIYVMTHDSIGLGEDGPTHQPVEHLASLRAMPNVLVLRPADAIECAECWDIALKADKTPSILVLTRQGLPTLRDGSAQENLSAKGGYIHTDLSEGNRDITLIATGSEVPLAVEAAKELKEQGLSPCVVSLPCWELFEQQGEEYQNAVLGTAPRIAIEAAVELGWQRWLQPGDAFIGMKSFGASAPIDELFEHFGITKQAIIAKAKQLSSK